MLEDFLRTLRCVPSRYDRDVWMRLRDDKSGYDFIYTHVGELKVVAKNPSIWIEQIASTFIIKEHGPRSYYRNNDYSYHDGQNMWTYGCQSYTKEEVSRVERIYECLPKESTPLPVIDCHPELNKSPLLCLDNHRKFQYNGWSK